MDNGSGFRERVYIWIKDYFIVILHIINYHKNTSFALLSVSCHNTNWVSLTSDNFHHRLLYFINQPFKKKKKKGGVCFLSSISLGTFQIIIITFIIIHTYTTSFAFITCISYVIIQKNEFPNDYWQGNYGQLARE